LNRCGKNTESGAFQSIMMANNCLRRINNLLSQMNDLQAGFNNVE